MKCEMWKIINFHLCSFDKWFCSVSQTNQIIQSQPGHSLKSISGIQDFWMSLSLRQIFLCFWFFFWSYLEFRQKRGENKERAPRMGAARLSIKSQKAFNRMSYCLKRRNITISMLLVCALLHAEIDRDTSRL